MQIPAANTTPIETRDKINRRKPLEDALRELPLLFMKSPAEQEWVLQASSSDGLVEALQSIWS